MFYGKRSSSSYSDDKSYSYNNYSSDMSSLSSLPPRNLSLQRVMNSEYGRRDRSLSPSRDYSSSSRLFRPLSSGYSGDISPTLQIRDASPSQTLNDSRSSPKSFLDDDLRYGAKSRNYYDFSSASTGLYSSYSAMPIKRPKRTDYSDYLRPVLSARPMLKTGYIPRSRADRDHDTNPITRDRRLIKFREMSDEVIEKIRRKISWDIPEEISSPLIDEMKQKDRECEDKSESMKENSSRRGSNDTSCSSRRGSKDGSSSSRRGSKDISCSSRRGSKDVSSSSRRGSRDISSPTSGSPRPPESRRPSCDQDFDSPIRPPLRKHSRNNSLISSAIDSIHNHSDSIPDDANFYPKAPIPPPRKKSLGTAHRLKKPRKSSVEILLSEEKTQNYSKIAAEIRRNRELAESSKKLADQSARENEQDEEAAANIAEEESAESASDRSRRRRRRISGAELDPSEEKPPEVRRRRRSRFTSRESNESLSPSADLNRTSEDRFADETPRPVSRMHRKSVKYKPDGLSPRRASKGSPGISDSFQKKSSKVEPKEANTQTDIKKLSRAVCNEESNVKSKIQADQKKFQIGESITKSELNKEVLPKLLENKENVRNLGKAVNKNEDIKMGNIETSKRNFLKNKKEEINTKISTDIGLKSDNKITNTKIESQISKPVIKETETKLESENKLIQINAISDKITKTANKKTDSEILGKSQKEVPDKASKIEVKQTNLKALNKNLTIDVKNTDIKQLNEDIPSSEREKVAVIDTSKVELGTGTLKSNKDTVPPVSKLNTSISPNKEIEEVVVICKLPQPKKTDFGFAKESISVEQKVVISIKGAIIKPLDVTESINESNVASKGRSVIPTGKSDSKLREIVNEVPDVNVTHVVVLKPKAQNSVQTSKTEKDGKLLKAIPDVIKSTVNSGTKTSDDISDVVKSTLSKSDVPSKAKVTTLPDIKADILVKKCDKNTGKDTNSLVSLSSVPQIVTQVLDKTSENNQITNGKSLVPKQLTATKAVQNIKKSNSDIFEKLKEANTEERLANIKKSNSDVFSKANKQEKSSIKPDLIQMATNLTEKSDKPLVSVSEDVMNNNKQLTDAHAKTQNKSQLGKNDKELEISQLKNKREDKTVLESFKDSASLSNMCETKIFFKGNEPKEIVVKAKTSVIEKSDMNDLKINSIAMEKQKAVPEKLELIETGDKKREKCAEKPEINEKLESKQTVAATRLENKEKLNRTFEGNKTTLPELELKTCIKDVDNLNSKYPGKTLTFLDEVKQPKHAIHGYKKSMTVPDMTALSKEPNSSQYKTTAVTNVQKTEVTSLSSDNVPDTLKGEKTFTQSKHAIIDKSETKNLKGNDEKTNSVPNKREALPNDVLKLPQINSCDVSIQKAVEPIQETKNQMPVSNKKISPIRTKDETKTSDEKMPLNKNEKLSVESKLKSDIKIKDSVEITKDPSKTLNSSEGEKETSIQKVKDSSPLVSKRDTVETSAQKMKEGSPLVSKRIAENSTQKSREGSPLVSKRDIVENNVQKTKEGSPLVNKRGVENSTQKIKEGSALVNKCDITENSTQKLKESSPLVSKRDISESTIPKIPDVTTKAKQDIVAKHEKLPPVNGVSLNENLVNLKDSIPASTIDEKCQKDVKAIEPKTEQNSVCEPIVNDEKKPHEVQSKIFPVIQKEVEILIKDDKTEPKLPQLPQVKQSLDEVKVTYQAQQPKPKVPKIPVYKRFGLVVKPKEPILESSSSDEETESETETESSSEEESTPIVNKTSRFRNGKGSEQSEKGRTFSETSNASIDSCVSNGTTCTTIGVCSDDEYGSPKRTSSKSLRFRKYGLGDFTFLKLLGKGSFGKVLLAQLKDTEMYFAIKCLKKDVVLEDDDVESTMIERRVLALGTQHPYMCKLYCTFQSESYLYFVMEYLNGGDLMFHIQENGRFEEKRAMFYGAEIVSALKFLHKRGIVYRDIKLDNIILDEDGHVHLVDFGMCKTGMLETKSTSTFCGTPDYIPPEIVMGKTYNESVDWWSFGVLLYEMLVGRSPFQGTDEDELFWSVCNEEPPYPRFLSKEAIHILGLLLVKSPAKRLGMPSCPAGDIRDHAFFSSIDWEKVELKQIPPIFKPKVSSAFDTRNFDSSFTTDSASLDPVDSTVLKSMDQEQFNGFSYTNPHLTG